MPSSDTSNLRSAIIPRKISVTIGALWNHFNDIADHSAK
jgi:hypothetical protein